MKLDWTKGKPPIDVEGHYLVWSSQHPKEEQIAIYTLWLTSLEGDAIFEQLINRGCMDEGEWDEIEAWAPMPEGPDASLLG